MKGITFQKPFELVLNVEGESWRQGDAISGTLTIKNRDSSEVALKDLHVSLAYADFKAVRAKAPDAFEIVAKTEWNGASKLASQKEEKLSWRFQTDRNCPVTEKSASLFLIFGQGTATEKLGQLQLPVTPDPIIEEFLKTFQIQFRFVLKFMKSNKGWVEIKLDPPSAKNFAAVEHLMLLFKFEGETLHLKYQFAVQKMEATAASVTMKKSKKDFQQSFTKDQYLVPSGRFNHERIEAAIQEVLQQVGIAGL